MWIPYEETFSILSLRYFALETNLWQGDVTDLVGACPFIRMRGSSHWCKHIRSCGEVYVFCPSGESFHVR